MREVWGDGGSCSAMDRGRSSVGWDGGMGGFKGGENGIVATEPFGDEIERARGLQGARKNWVFAHGALGFGLEGAGDAVEAEEVLARQSVAIDHHVPADRADHLFRQRQDLFAHVGQQRGWVQSRDVNASILGREINKRRGGSLWSFS